MVRPIPETHVYLMHRRRHARELPEQFVTLALLVRQYGSDAVGAIVLVFLEVARRSIEEDVVLHDRAADADGRADFGREQRIAERAGRNARLRDVRRDLEPGDQALRQKVHAADTCELIGSRAADRIRDNAAGAA